jgi:hypothetical protein
MLAAFDFELMGCGLLCLNCLVGILCVCRRLVARFSQMEGRGFRNSEAFAF